MSVWGRIFSFWGSANFQNAFFICVLLSHIYLFLPIRVCKVIAPFLFIFFIWHMNSFYLLCYSVDEFHLFSYYLRRRQWQPTPVHLPGKSHGRRGLEGCSPWGRWGLDTTERLRFPFALSCFGEGNGNPLQCSCLENPRDRGAWWAAIYGVAQSRTRLKRLSSSSTYYLRFREEGRAQLWLCTAFVGIPALCPPGIL